MAENQENESAAEPIAAAAASEPKAGRANRSQKVGTVASDKMTNTVVVRVDRLVRHRKYRRYVRRTSKFMAHDELGATIGDKVRPAHSHPHSEEVIYILSGRGRVLVDGEVAPGRAGAPISRLAITPSSTEMRTSAAQPSGRRAERNHRLII